ncbi:hypothetical protein [Demequina gelatinilytica]|uniref:hypothetical protein n=1 Tax=Demequina gelatinilytica TaxID=1638980 RepID=UPI0007859FE8|nr:hypothetical protein [Demequina gelatinilytica]
MAYAPDDRCPEAGCRAPINFVYVPARRKSLRFDPTHVRRNGDPLAKWVAYPDPRTGATFARRLTPGEHVDFEGGEEVIRLHAAVCPAVVRGNHDS